MHIYDKVVIKYNKALNISFESNWSWNNNIVLRKYEKIFSGLGYCLASNSITSMYINPDFYKLLIQSLVL